MPLWAWLSHPYPSIRVGDADLPMRTVLGDLSTVTKPLAECAPSGPGRLPRPWRVRATVAEA